MKVRGASRRDARSVQERFEREDGALDVDEQKDKMQLKPQAYNVCARPRPLSVRKVEPSPK
jgi:hypothetical protein